MSASTLYEFWYSYGSDIQNGAVVLSAMAAFILIKEGRAIARKRGTLDMILHQESDGELISAREDFTVLKASITKLSKYGVPAKRTLLRR